MVRNMLVYFAALTQTLAFPLITFNNIFVALSLNSLLTLTSLMLRPAPPLNLSFSCVAPTDTLLKLTFFVSFHP